MIMSIEFNNFLAVPGSLECQKGKSVGCVSLLNRFLPLQALTLLKMLYATLACAALREVFDSVRTFSFFLWCCLSDFFLSLNFAL